MRKIKKIKLNFRISRHQEINLPVKTDILAAVEEDNQVVIYVAVKEKELDKIKYIFTVLREKDTIDDLLYKEYTFLNIVSLDNNKNKLFVFYKKSWLSWSSL